MTIREFWRSTFATSRAALVCAAVAIVINVGSYLGLGARWAGGALAVTHLAVMALGFILSARIAVHHSLAWRAAGERPRTTPLPARLVLGAVAAFAYMALAFIVFAAVYGEGGAQVRDGVEVWVDGESVVRTLPPGSVATFDARMLRVFSAAWLFFSLLIALASHRVEERIRGYRRARE